MREDALWPEWPQGLEASMRQRTGAYLVPGKDVRLAVELARQAEAWGYESL